MRNTPTATDRDEAIEATYLVTYAASAPTYILAKAQRARRDIYDGVTPATDYAAVVAYFTGAYDVLIMQNDTTAANGSIK